MVQRKALMGTWSITPGNTMDELRISHWLLGGPSCHSLETPHRNKARRAFNFTWTLGAFLWSHPTLVSLLFLGLPLGLSL